MPKLITEIKDSKMKKDFEIFKKEFKKWQDRLELNDWQVYFKNKPIGNSFACLELQYTGRVASASLNTSVPDGDKEFRDPISSAKHEAFHLLLSDLVGVASDRYVDEAQIDREEERLVVKLMSIIK
jgi:hypothetical protein